MKSTRNQGQRKFPVMQINSRPLIIKGVNVCMLCGTVLVSHFLVLCLGIFKGSSSDSRDQIISPTPTDQQDEETDKR